jgi:hypothetical protein
LRNVLDDDVAVAGYCLQGVGGEEHKIPVFDDEECGCVGLGMNAACRGEVVPWFALNIIGLNELLNSGEDFTFIVSLQSM